MSRLWIKVCGVRTREAIEAAARAGADAVGFVFYEASPRNLSMDQAIELERAVPAEVDRVAVFLHPAQELVEAVIEAIRPAWIQADAADLEKLQLPNGPRQLPVRCRGAACSRAR
jgi:phosphoribosylanthranilate isomerase